MDYKQIPNIITLGRIVLTIPIVVLFGWISSSHLIQLLIFILTLICVISDFLDGHLARRWDCVSDFGKIHDPLADKMLVLLYVPLVSIGMIHFVPVSILLARDFLSTHLRTISKVITPAKTSGKIKTFVNLFFLCILIAAIPVKDSYFFFLDGLQITFFWVSGICISTVCIWSGIDYYFSMSLNTMGND